MLGATLNLATRCERGRAITAHLPWPGVRRTRTWTRPMIEVTLRGLETRSPSSPHSSRKGLCRERYARIAAHLREWRGSHQCGQHRAHAVDAMRGPMSLKVKTSTTTGTARGDLRRRSRHPTGSKEPNLRALLHYQGRRRGYGVGPRLVRRIVAGHGGEIRVDSAPGETTFKVRLPIDGPRRGPGNEVNDATNGEINGDGG